MSWLLYLSDNSGLEDRLFKVIDASVPKSDFEICRSPQDLSKRLRQPCLDVRVMVLCIESKEAWREILSLRDLLSERKNILILPDEDEDTMAEVFTLSPRFITWVDSDFRDLGAVLKRMLDLYDALPSPILTEKA
jgi:hypothetical protein